MNILSPSPRAIEILQSQLNKHPELIFPSDRGKPYSDMAFTQLLRRLGHDFTVHGFRSTFRDWAAEQTSFPREVCEAALAHSSKDATEAAYFRSDLFEKRREMMHAWADYCCVERTLATNSEYCCVERTLATNSESPRKP